MHTEEETAPREMYRKITANIEQIMQGQSKAIRKLLAGFVSGGHILLEDYPGTGKTTLAKALALSFDARFKRIQFTPDVLPSDILGVSIFDQKTRDFSFHKGPIFTDILLADEINRASPRTQSALLEAMAERQVSIDGRIRPLTELFFVIATQNPVEFHGTYPLPEAQMDRFALKFSLGYVSAADEVAILTLQGQDHPTESVKPCVSREDILFLKRNLDGVRISEKAKRYIVDIVTATRVYPGVRIGASPRASVSLMKTAAALAMFDGYAYVTPDHIQEIAVPVIAHRILMDSEARFSGQTGETVVQNVMERIPVPS